MKAEVHLPTRRIQKLTGCWSSRFGTTGITALLLLTSLASGGCIDTRYVRVPQLFPRSAETERLVAEYHDPFPDDGLGPSTNSRPPGYSRQRTATRRAAELRGIHMLEPGDRLPPTGGQPPRTSQAVSID